MAEPFNSLYSNKESKKSLLVPTYSEVGYLDIKYNIVNDRITP